MDDGKTSLILAVCALELFFLECFFSTFSMSSAILILNFLPWSDILAHTQPLAIHAECTFFLLLRLRKSCMLRYVESSKIVRPDALRAFLRYNIRSTRSLAKNRVSIICLESLTSPTL